MTTACNTDNLPRGSVPCATCNNISGDADGERQPKRCGFLLLGNFSMTAFASAAEPLRMANWIRNEDLYEILTLTTDGQPVTCSAGIRVMPDYSLTARCDQGHNITDTLDVVFVVGASPVAPTINDQAIAWLRAFNTLNRDEATMSIGGIGTGSYVLACAGLLDGYKATVHWWSNDALKNEFPLIQLTDGLYEIDGNRYTCSGGTAATDMMLFVIGKHHGMELSASISEQFVCERLRTTDDAYQTPLRHRIGSAQPKLVEAVTLMETNLEELLTTDDIAFHVGLSRRHLERLFKKHLQTLPSRYYLQLRMEKARRLLRMTEQPVLQVGLSCGFTSASHFSTAYRNHFGLTPREERKRRQEIA
ncbi:GlxA family transcriptional regulator [Endozoicomonadaceae bacterium StTr2]